MISKIMEQNYKVVPDLMFLFMLTENQESSVSAIPTDRPKERGTLSSDGTNSNPRFLSRNHFVVNLLEENA